MVENLVSMPYRKIQEQYQSKDTNSHSRTSSIAGTMACSNRCDDSRNKGDSGESQRKGASKTRAVRASGPRTSAAGARKSTKIFVAIPTPTTKRRKKNSDADPLFVDPPDDAYAPYFIKFEGKRAPKIYHCGRPCSVLVLRRRV